MNQKIENYVNMLFKDVPRSKKATELREEILSDLNERFEDLIREGKSENEAYGTAVASLGNIDELLSEVMPDEEFRKLATQYRNRKAKYVSIGVALYIVGVIALIGFGSMGALVFHNEDVFGVIGLLIMLVLAAAATGLIIYGSMSTPVEFKDFEQQKKRMKNENMTDAEKILNGVSSIYWSVIALIYLAISFITFKWGTTWVIWLLAGILWVIVETIFEMRNGNE